MEAVKIHPPEGYEVCPTSTQTEIFEDLLDFEGLYKISKNGNVLMLEKSYFTGRKKTSKVTMSERVIYKHIDKDGYQYVYLMKNGIKLIRKVHRLVATQFIDNPFKKKQVNHINGIKDDNRVENLEWCTNSENIQHSINVIGTIKTLSNSPFAKKVNQYDLDGNVVKEWGSIKEASKSLNINSSSISLSCRGRQKTAGSFIWKYVAKPLL